MKVTVLVENTTCNKNLKSQHGLSFYIETANLKILFDCGANDLFIKNAVKLGLNISAIDYLILSHGHYDHGGGLAEFLKINTKAKIFVNTHAFNDYYFKVLFFKKYIGLDKSIMNNDRIVFVGNELELTDDMFIFSDITKDKFRSAKNKLIKKENGKFTPDDFKHEQCLIINDVLFAGCAHTGIVNIYEKAKSLKTIRYIFGGFHLYNPITKKTEDKSLIENIGNVLKNEDLKIYTGHCTGKKALKTLKPIFGEKIEEISTGEIYNILSF